MKSMNRHLGFQLLGNVNLQSCDQVSDHANLFNTRPFFPIIGIFSGYIALFTIKKKL